MRIAALTLLLVACAWGQAAEKHAPAEAEETNNKEWEFSLAAWGYLVPDDTSYFSPTFTADHNWLHLEARYNYENQETGSLWAGYNFSVGHKLTLEVTPMFGAVFGNTTGIAPGCNILLTYKRIDVSTQCEYVIDLKDKSGNFFYTWSEFGYSPTDWLRVGLAAQHTRAYQTPLDIQRGFLVGVSHKHVDFTTYVFNAGWTDPTVVLGLGFHF